MKEIVAFPCRQLMYGIFPRGGVGAEIGVCRGVNAAVLWMVARPKILHLVDTWEVNESTLINHPPAMHYGNWEADVKQLFEGIEGVSTHKANSIFFLQSLPDASLDWVYIDGDHNYATLKHELELAAKKVRAGGIIAGHDLVVHESAWKSGVVRATIEAIQMGTLSMIAITDEQWPSFALKRL
jgi:predicted O-methyltransferase YrrM